MWFNLIKWDKKLPDDKKAAKFAGSRSRRGLNAQSARKGTKSGPLGKLFTKGKRLNLSEKENEI